MTYINKYYGKKVFFEFHDLESVVYHTVTVDTPIASLHKLICHAEKIYWIDDNKINYIKSRYNAGTTTPISDDDIIVLRLKARPAVM